MPPHRSAGRRSNWHRRGQRYRVPGLSVIAALAIGGTGKLIQLDPAELHDEAEDLATAKPGEDGSIQARAIFTFSKLFTVALADTLQAAALPPLTNADELQQRTLQPHHLRDAPLPSHGSDRC